MNPLSWVVFAALCVMLLWSCRAFFDYGDLFAQLGDKSPVERGRIGLNEYRSFLARAGRANFQRGFAQTQARIRGDLQLARARGQDYVDYMINGRVVRVRSERDLPSQVADSWAWVVKSGQILPADAKVFMNVPESAFYYAASTFWFPRRVDVSFTPVGIRDDQQLRSIFLKDRWRLDPERLDELSQQAKAAGYTHLVTRKRDGEAVLMPLRDVAGGTNP